MFKILIIEDNDDNRDILKHQLAYLGYEVVEAVDGLAGLEAVTKEKPDLVIVDIMMPGDSRTKDLPVLAATVLFHTEDIHSCLVAGCNDVLTKPFTLQQLKEKLDKFSHLSASPK
ncbi:MAG: response regulator [Deltaproteobacteria bacterium]|nr:response regulator [Deltaproteobacteria bacterium]